ncbi:MAG TPA: DUF1501 domain-containing protein [Candidatus Dormibacteraeota bacterium]|nr:DUF1501 domain-containing protein [Candidatus Dormibacteraeota bacterium]
MITRRDFLAAGLATAGAGITVPPILAQGVFAATAEGVHNDHVLVVLQWGGGNDGLNTVVPYADPAYHDARPTIGVAPESVLDLDGKVGFHPALTGVKALYDRGRVAVVQGVGYPNPTYSHFEALHVWEYADPARASTSGWLGALLASGRLDVSDHPLACVAAGQASTPTELRAPGAQVSVIQSSQGYAIEGGAARTTAAPALYRSTPGPYGALFDQALSTARAGIAELSAASAYAPAAQYEPKGVVYGSKIDLASSLQLAARIIVTQPSAKVVHVVLGGFDTHQQEDSRHQSLLAAVDAGVSAFMQDLAAHGQDRRVTLMTWSEFGRRVRENGSRGTDHGAAMPMLVMGGAVAGGLYGEAPSLTSTVDGGNLKYTVDFRSVYQAVIRDWLGADPSGVLGGTYPEVGLRWSAAG